MNKTEYRKQMYRYFRSSGMPVEKAKCLSSSDIDEFIKEGLTPDEAAWEEILCLDHF